MLQLLGNGDIRPETIRCAEKFICRLYKVQTADTCDKARVILFRKCRSQEALPPTTDAAHLHIKRAHYQSMVWLQASCPTPQLPQVTDMGWFYSNGKLVPKLMSLPPIPDACTEIVSCGCKKGCLTERCGCRKMRLPCVAYCSCMDTDIKCRNVLD